MKYPTFEKIARNGGIYDTKKYRYAIVATNKMLRCDINIIGTTEGLNPDNWETIKTK